MNYRIDPKQIGRHFQKVGKRLYEFNRGVKGPLRPVARLLAKYDALASSEKVAISLGVGVIFSIVMIRYFMIRILPAIDVYIHSAAEAKLFTFLHLDQAVRIASVMLVIFVFSIFSGRPEKTDEKQGRPFVRFLFFVPLFFFGLMIFPFLDMQSILRMEISHGGLSALMDSQDYGAEALGLILALAVCFADDAVKKRAVHWWLIPFLPGSPPIVLANLLAGIFPSRLWRGFRLVAVALTLVGPLIIYVDSPPLKRGIDIFTAKNYVSYSSVGKAPRERLTRGIAWDVKSFPEKPCVFLRADLDIHEYCKQGSEWDLVGAKNLHISSEASSYDFKRKRIYIYDGTTHILSIFDMNRLRLLMRVPISFVDLPTKAVDVEQAFDPVTDTLVVNVVDMLIAIDVKTMKVISSRFKTMGTDKIWKLAVDSEAGELYVLYCHHLGVYSIPELIPRRLLMIRDEAMDMLMDQRGNRVFISFPWKAKVSVLEKTTFRHITDIDAPLGVRSLKMDYRRNVLFFGSGTGAVEMRDANDFQLLARVRMNPWIRRMEVVEESGDLIVASGTQGPVAWQYDPIQESFDYADKCLRLSEKIFHVFKNHQKKIVQSTMFKLSENLPSTEYIAKYKGNETVLVLEPPGENREMARALLKWSGYDAIFTAIVDEFKNALTDSTKVVDVALIPWASDGINRIDLVDFITRVDSCIQVLFSGSDMPPGNFIKEGISRDRYIKKPYLLDSFLSNMRHQLEGQRSPDLCRKIKLAEMKSNNP